jgi:tetratricopeptide (TPR) repeat protein
MGEKLLDFYVFNRIVISIVLIGVGITWGILDSWTFAWFFVATGSIMLLAHFLLGPIRMVQKAVEKGDLEKAQKALSLVKYPSLLIKPVRSIFYMLQSNMALGNKDYSKAEEFIKKSTSLGMPMKDMDAMAVFQHGTIAFQKGDNKTAILKLREAISKGLTESDSLAGAHLILCNIFLTRKDNKTAKMHFKNAKSAKPKSKEILDQIKQLDSYIARIPG